MSMSKTKLARYRVTPLLAGVGAFLRRQMSLSMALAVSLSMNVKLGRRAWG